MEFRKSSVEEMNSPHLLVIGGTGFIGHHLLRAAHQRDWKMTSVSLNPPTENRFVNGVRYLHFDLSKRDLVKNNLAEDFDYVVNLGGYINHKLFKDGGGNLIDTHFITIQNLVEVLPRNKLKRFVQIGSSDEYGNAPAPQHEELREQPISPYSLAKVASTHFLQMLHRTEKFPAVILRLFLTYGPGQDSSRFIPQIVLGCLKGATFPSSAGEQFRDFCYVEDTVRAILQALDVSEVEGEVINVASGDPVSIREMIEMIRELIGSGFPQYGKLPYRPRENMKLYASIKKKKHILNIKSQVCLKDGLLKTIKYYQES
jgi:nucleoside-diphosphate-sugar epimerase